MFMLLSWVLFGLVVGVISRMIYPGKEDLGFSGTIVLGIIGSFVGGAINYMLGWGNELFSSSGFLMSIVGSLVACFLWLNKNTISEWLQKNLLK